MSSPRPHDLLRLCPPVKLTIDAPPWVGRALDVAPWVVVRRSTAPVGRIAVGVRGADRSARHAGELAAAEVRELVAPEQLAHVEPLPNRSTGAMRTLAAVRPLLDDVGLTWGPTGSVGFELATGVPTTTPESDLDLLIRMPRASAELIARLANVHRVLSDGAVRVDCQIETRCGAIALAELVGDQRDLVVRTPEGPRLVARSVAES